MLVVDNFYCGTRGNIEELLGHPRFELLRHDVTFPLYVEVDEIYHLACPASPVFYQRDPVQTTKTCVHGSINMLGLAKRTGAKILLASTSEVYGDPAVHPQTRTTGATSTPSASAPVTTRASGAPRRCSSTTTASTGSGSRSRASSTPTARGWPPTTAASCPTSSSRRSPAQPLTIFGDGSQTRSFCYVDDLVDGLIRLMDSDDDVTGPINLGNPGEFTMLELAEQVRDLAGQGEIEHRPLPTDDPARRRPDISQATSVLGWQPTVELGDGLARTVDYFRSVLT